MENKTIKKFSEFDFSNHIIKVKKDELCKIITLKEKDSNYYNRVDFILVNNHLVINGDYGDWICSKPFDPTVPDDLFEYTGYFTEKLKYNTEQEISEFDSDETRKELNKLLDENVQEEISGRKFNEDEKEFIRELLDAVDDEFEYSYKAYREYHYGKHDYFGDYERIPFCKKLKYHLLVILDAFNEITKRSNEIHRMENKTDDKNYFETDEFLKKLMEYDGK